MATHIHIRDTNGIVTGYENPIAVYENGVVIWARAPRFQVGDNVMFHNIVRDRDLRGRCGRIEYVCLGTSTYEYAVSIEDQHVPGCSGKFSIPVGKGIWAAEQDLEPCLFAFGDRLKYDGEEVLFLRPAQANGISVVFPNGVILEVPVAEVIRV